MENDFTCENYHSILCKEVPDFLRKYFNLGLLTRLDKIGLLCGTDWTPLFKNKFFYSRFNHSLGVALIIWNFTHDKKQSIAGLLHDVSTPAFSHVVDFKNGDALKQESTESLNENLILNDKSLKEKLALDGLVPSDVKNYHLFPIADNEMPGLSADRLEYMYPSGAALNSVWSLEEVKKNYSSIEILKNEKNELELGFVDEKEALLYTEKFFCVAPGDFIISIPRDFTICDSAIQKSGEFPCHTAIGGDHVRTEVKSILKFLQESISKFRIPGKGVVAASG
jgi:hypothetical protein